MIFKKKVIYNQIDEYLAKKSERYYLASIMDREYLLLFVKTMKLDTVFDITEHEINAFQKFLLNKYPSNAPVHNARKAIRCFYRYHKNVSQKKFKMNMSLLMQGG